MDPLPSSHYQDPNQFPADPYSPAPVDQAFDQQQAIQDSLGAAQSFDPFAMANQAGQAMGNANPYRFTGMYGTLGDSVDTRSRQQVRRRLNEHMLKAEAEKARMWAASFLRAGHKNLTPEQQQALTAVSTGNITNSAIGVMSALGYSPQTDGVQSAMGLESSLRFTADHISGASRMDDERRIRVASGVAERLYQPGAGRTGAMGLSGQDVAELSFGMAMRGELAGGHTVQADMDRVRRMSPEARRRPGMTQAQKDSIREIENLQTLQDAAAAPGQTKEELKKSVKAYEEAMDEAIIKRQVKAIQGKARSVATVQQYFKTHLGIPDLSSGEASAVVQQLGGSSAQMTTEEATLTTNRFLAMARGAAGGDAASVQEMIAHRARGSQMAEAFGLSSKFGAEIALDALGTTRAREGQGMFSQDTVIYGIGDQDEETMESQYLAASFAASGANRAKAAILNLEKLNGKLEGPLGAIAEKVRSGQPLSDSEAALLRSPGQMLSEMEKAAPGMDASYLQKLLEDEKYAQDLAFKDPEAALAGRHEVQSQELRDTMGKYLADEVTNDNSKGKHKTTIGKKNQLAAAQATMERMRNIDPSQLENYDIATGGEVTQQAAYESLLEMRDAGQISGTDEELEAESRRVAKHVATAAVNSATASGRESAEEFLTDINDNTERIRRRESRVQKRMAQYTARATELKGEGPVVGLKATLEEAEKQGQQLSVGDMAHAVISGAADGRQVEIAEEERNIINDEIANLALRRAQGKTDGTLTEAEDEQIQEDIAVLNQLKDRLDKIIDYDEGSGAAEGEEGKDGKGGKKPGEDETVYGPGGNTSGAITMTNVTLTFEGQEYSGTVKGTASYGGLSQVPVTG